MARITPVVQGEILRWSVDGHEQQLAVGTPAWYSWLEKASLFAFVGESDTFTARKEPKPHGATYWRAYRKQGGRLYRAYLGKSEQLTLERLNAIAALLARRAEGEEALPMQGTNEETLDMHAASASNEPVGRREDSCPDPTPASQHILPDMDVVNLPASNLPVPLTTLIGREQERATVCGLLRRPEVRLLTLTGTGGIGKTRLGLQVARDLLADFADGVYFVSLAPISDPDLVVPTIAQTLGLKDAGGQPPLELLKASLSQKRLLLLLDNFEQVLAAAPQLSELLVACPHLKLLVTSRAVLHLRGEHEFPVPPLALPDLTQLPESETLAQVAAVALFLQRAWATNPNLQLTSPNARAIAQICVQLDGLPLAIELAAARSKLLPPQALLARLGQRLAVLTSGAQDAPARQQTLRNTIAWSYNLLTAQEQQLFRRLSAFVGGCTLQAVETLCHSLEDGRGAEWILDGVASLLDKSLLQQTEQEGEEPRLMMLETIREYGLECLRSSGELERTRQAHAAYYLALAQEAATTWYGPEQQAWCDRLEQEHDNLRAALQWLLEGQETALALQFSNALWWFWYTRAHVREGQTFLEKALAASEELATPARAQALHYLGLLFEFLGEYQQAEKSCEESVALYRELGDPAGAAWACYALGQVAADQDEYSRAHALLEEALTFFREARDPLGGHFVLAHLTMVYTQQGEYVKARACAEESLALAKQLGDQDTTAFTLLLLGKVLFVSQAGSRALEPVLEEYFSLAPEERDQTRMVAPDRLEKITPSTRMYGRLDLLGKMALSQGDVVKAQALFEESLAFNRTQGHRSDTAEALAVLGQVATVQHDYATALARYEEGLLLAREIGNKGKIASCLEGLAGVRAAQGELLQSARLWGAAEVLREAIGAPIPPVYRPAYERSVTAARAQFGEKPFAAAWVQGRTMTLEQVLAAQEPVPMLPAMSANPSMAPSVPKAPTYPDGLTDREVEVLRLVAQGLTDPQVAEQLVISPHTVNSHLKAIYGKIGVSSRSAATRYAIDHHLL
jgi:predicted ATPase/DNA-binding CsgD family transcriptional regulator